MIEVPLLEIERFAVNDGPGIRSVVFLKGCPLRCPWCANPESQRYGPETICRNGEKIWIGRPVEAEEVMKILERDAAYYVSSGGGITFSGGEALSHPQVLCHLLRCCRERGWHTAVETSGAVPLSCWQSLLPWVNLFLFDLKHTDAQRLYQVTGAEFDRIFAALQTIVDTGIPVILRMPCIPGFNLSDDHFAAAFRLALRLGIPRIDLLPYHTLGVAKYAQLERNYTYPLTPLSPQELQGYKELGEAMGLQINIEG
ncbi:MAG: glycyl-radical enzyme activating protein [Bacteroides sp.]